jgi:sugar phosphate isomerase/epimerase
MREASNGRSGGRPAHAGSAPGRQELAGRLGLDVPAGWWPTAHMLKGIEAAGFEWVQVRTPPRSVLCDGESVGRHAAALRTALDTCGLRLVLHGPDDLSAGTPDHDCALDGLLDYAAHTAAQYVVYHGANFPIQDGGEAAARTRDRLAREESSLRARVSRLESMPCTLAIENLAPVWPGPPRLGHAPAFVHDLVDRLDSARVGMTFDVGHAQIAGEVLGTDAAALIGPASEAVALFHLHDNLGVRRGGVGVAGVDPIQLDLHLPPGAGSIPWERIGAQLVDHRAPLMLELHPPHRPDPVRVADVTCELLLATRRRSAHPPAIARQRAAHPTAPPAG